MSPDLTLPPDVAEAHGRYLASDTAFAVPVLRVGECNVEQIRRLERSAFQREEPQQPQLRGGQKQPNPAGAPEPASRASAASNAAGQPGRWLQGKQVKGAVAARDPL